MIQMLLFSAAIAFTPQEKELDAKLPEIFERSAAHYRALEAAAFPLREGKVATNGIASSPYRIPHTYKPSKEDGARRYDMREIFWWTAGHFPGSLWYLYEATGDEFFRTKALDWTKLLKPAKEMTSNHDIGFIMYCAYGNARRLLKTKEFDPVLVRSAESLAARYSPQLGLIRSWGRIGDTKEFLVIPDNMMNLELLEFAATAKGGSKRFDEIARSHADRSMANHFRDDGGCYHVLNYDQRPGFLGDVAEIRRGQGKSCRTAWSRGQSWGIYGYVMMYRLTAQRRYLDFAMKLADYAIDHPNMPADGVPLWDYGARPDEQRDSSAAAIMASALMELSTYVNASLRARYRGFAVKQLLALASRDYFSEGSEIGHFLLKHGVGHKPGDGEIDVPLDYGDYYFLEALLRYRGIVAAEKALPAMAARLPPAAGLPEDEFDVRIWFYADGKKPDAARLAKAMDEPIPDTADRLYLDYSTNGNRSRYQDAYFDRLGRLDLLVAAEIEEGKGRYLGRISEYIAAICDMRSWILPAHEKEVIGNFERRLQSVDLTSSEVAAHLACAVQKLGARLDPALVARVKDETERRIFAPLRRELRWHGNQRSGGDVSAIDAWQPFPCHHWWVSGHNNWNAVCWDNVLCTVFGLLDDARDRAYFTDAAVKSIPVYLGGFTPDGYCSEGVGYWNYGYGHHLLMGRLLRKLTDGRFDIFTTPIQRSAGEYATKYMLVNGVSPAFADGNGAPSKRGLQLCEEFWPGSTRTAGDSTVFPDGQVWLFRDPDGISVAFKGGHNAELHNHNDVGSYYLMVGDRVVSGDPGAELYTARTFSARRYDSKVLSSYGHPLPVIGGRLQPEGSAHRAKILRTELTDGVSEVEMDLTAAYDVGSLKSLVRTFRYDRAAKTFTVTDRVKFSEPTAFEDAYVMFLEKDNPSGGRLLGYGYRPEVSVKGGAYTLREETIENPERVVPHRVGIALDNPVSEAEVAFAFSAGR